MLGQRKKLPGIFISESMPTLDRFTYYSRSPYPHIRLAFVERLADVAREVGAAATAHMILPTLRAVAVDEHQTVRRALAAQLPELAEYLYSCPLVAPPPPPPLGSENYASSTTVFPVKPPTLNVFGDEMDFLERRFSPDSALSGGSSSNTSGQSTVGSSNPSGNSSGSGSGSKSFFGSFMNLFNRKSDIQRPPTPVAGNSGSTGSSSGVMISDVPPLQGPDSELDKDPRPRGPTTTALNQATSAWSEHTASLLNAEDGVTTGYSHVLASVIPALILLLTDDESEVRAVAAKGIVRVAALLTERDIGHVLLIFILRVAHEGPEAHRLAALYLLHDLAPFLGRDLCRSFVTSELNAFADEPAHKLRTAAAQCFGKVFATVGPEVGCSRLLSSFLKLCADPVWTIRQAALASLPKVASTLTESQIRRRLAPAIRALLRDRSQFVVDTAASELGHIFCAVPPSMYPTLMGDFTRAVDSAVAAALGLGPGSGASPAATSPQAASFGLGLSGPGLAGNGNLATTGASGPGGAKGTVPALARTLAESLLGAVFAALGHPLLVLQFRLASDRLRRGIRRRLRVAAALATLESQHRQRGENQQNAVQSPQQSHAPDSTSSLITGLGLETSLAHSPSLSRSQMTSPMGLGGGSLRRHRMSMSRSRTNRGPLIGASASRTRRISISSSTGASASVSAARSISRNASGSISTLAAAAASTYAASGLAIAPPLQGSRNGPMSPTPGTPTQSFSLDLDTDDAVLRVVHAHIESRREKLQGEYQVYSDNALLDGLPLEFAPDDNPLIPPVSTNHYRANQEVLSPNDLAVQTPPLTSPPMQSETPLRTETLRETTSSSTQLDPAAEALRVSQQVEAVVAAAESDIARFEHEFEGPRDLDQKSVTSSLSDVSTAYSELSSDSTGLPPPKHPHLPTEQLIQEANAAKEDRWDNLLEEDSEDEVDVDVEELFYPDLQDDEIAFSFNSAVTQITASGLTSLDANRNVNKTVPSMAVGAAPVIAGRSVQGNLTQSASSMSQDPESAAARHRVKTLVGNAHEILQAARERTLEWSSELRFLAQRVDLAVDRMFLRLQRYQYEEMERKYQSSGSNGDESGQKAKEHNSDEKSKRIRFTPAEQLLPFGARTLQTVVPAVLFPALYHHFFHQRSKPPPPRLTPQQQLQIQLEYHQKSVAPFNQIASASVAFNPDASDPRQDLVLSLDGDSEFASLPFLASIYGDVPALSILTPAAAVSYLHLLQVPVPSEYQLTAAGARAYPLWLYTQLRLLKRSLSLPEPGKIARVWPRLPPLPMLSLTLRNLRSTEYIYSWVTTLAAHPGYQVREALATALPVIARMVGPLFAPHVLLPVLTQLLRDPFEDVRTPIFRRFGALLAAFAPSLRFSILRLGAFGKELNMNDQSAWRLRLLLARQLPFIAMLVLCPHVDLRKEVIAQVDAYMVTAKREQLDKLAAQPTPDQRSGFSTQALNTPPQTKSSGDVASPEFKQGDHSSPEKEEYDDDEKKPDEVAEEEGAVDPARLAAMVEANARADATTHTWSSLAQVMLDNLPSRAPYANLRKAAQFSVAADASADADWWLEGGESKVSSNDSDAYESGLGLRRAVPFAALKFAAMEKTGKIKDGFSCPRESTQRAAYEELINQRLVAQTDQANELVDWAITLLKDPTSRVAAEAAHCFPQFMRILGELYGPVPEVILPKERSPWHRLTQELSSWGNPLAEQSLLLEIDAGLAQIEASRRKPQTDDDTPSDDAISASSTDQQADAAQTADAASLSVEVKVEGDEDDDNVEEDVDPTTTALGRKPEPTVTLHALTRGAATLLLTDLAAQHPIFNSAAGPKKSDTPTSPGVQRTKVASPTGEDAASQGPAAPVSKITTRARMPTNLVLTFLALAQHSLSALPTRTVELLFLRRLPNIIADAYTQRPGNSVSIRLAVLELAIAGLSPQMRAVVDSGDVGPAANVSALIHHHHSYLHLYNSTTTTRTPISPRKSEQEINDDTLKECNGWALSRHDLLNTIVRNCDLADAVRKWFGLSTPPGAKDPEFTREITGEVTFRDLFSRIVLLSRYDKSSSVANRAKNAKVLLQDRPDEDSLAAPTREDLVGPPLPESPAPASPFDVSLHEYLSHVQSLQRSPPPVAPAFALPGWRSRPGNWPEPAPNFLDALVSETDFDRAKRLQRSLDLQRAFHSAIQTQLLEDKMSYYAEPIIRPFTDPYMTGALHLRHMLSSAALVAAAAEQAARPLASGGSIGGSVAAATAAAMRGTASHDSHAADPSNDPSIVASLKALQSLRRKVLQKHNIPPERPLYASLQPTMPELPGLSSQLESLLPEIIEERIVGEEPVLVSLAPCSALRSLAETSELASKLAEEAFEDLDPTIVRIPGKQIPPENGKQSERDPIHRSEAHVEQASNEVEYLPVSFAEMLAQKGYAPGTSVRLAVLGADPTLVDDPTKWIQEHECLIPSVTRIITSGPATDDAVNPKRRANWSSLIPN